MWFFKEVGHTQEAKKELMELVDFDTSDDVFVTPKPTRLIERILQIASDKDSLILDSFAGSGTTGHAVLKQNAADGGNRRFTLVEMEAGIAEKITAERIRRVSEGYTDAKDNEVEGLGGGFQFCRLSEHSLFDEVGEIREQVRFAELAEFVWLCETGTGFTGSADGPLLGVHKGRAIYLLYNGILKDRTDVGGNVLNSRTLAVLPETPEAETRVVYGTRCRFAPERLEELGMEFKQLPYQLRNRT
jgi:site-specific DNA-methyltransferase (adenine-specific)/adenine-specific DNA-methyltransferase